MENDDIFAKIKFLLFSWVPPSKISFRPLWPIMSHVREWTEKKITHVHICPALVSSGFYNVFIEDRI